MAAENGRALTEKSPLAPVQGYGEDTTPNRVLGRSGNIGLKVLRSEAGTDSKAGNALMVEKQSDRSLTFCDK